MSEFFKEAIRRLLFPFLPAEIRATSGTLWFKFLEWLYGADECYPEFPCVWPDEEGK